MPTEALPPTGRCPHCDPVQYFDIPPSTGPVTFHGPAFVPLTGEAYFIDRDLFLRYVETDVNPARVAEGLDLVPNGAASHLFDVVTSGRYRR
jgi:hypothetical protein